MIGFQIANQYDIAVAQLRNALRLPPKKNLAKTWEITRIGVEKEFSNGSWRFYDTGRRIGSISSTWKKHTRPYHNKT